MRHQGAPEHVVKGAQDFVCDTCVETRKPLHQRPAKLRNPIEFNDRIGLDGFFWTGKGQFQCYVIHVYDEASGFHLAKRLDGRNMDHVIPALNDLWMIWPVHHGKFILTLLGNLDRLVEPPTIHEHQCFHDSRSMAAGKNRATWRHLEEHAT